MRVVFMGAPAFAVPTLKALSRLGVEIAAVYTKAPRPGGRRGLALTKTAVHLEAEALGLQVETPTSLKTPEAQKTFLDWRSDVAVVAAYGLLLPAPVLAAPRLGCFNLHGSLLPRWRGAAPVQRAVMAGDEETGVSIMRMEVGLDTGPIAGEVRTKIEPTETAEELTQRLAELAGRTLADNWAALAAGALPFAAQREEGVIYAAKIEKAEAPIDWTADAAVVRGHINGLSPFPGATARATIAGTMEMLKILRAVAVARDGTPGEILDETLTVACGRGAVRLLQVQRPGRNPVSGAEFMRSGALRVADRLNGRD